MVKSFFKKIKNKVIFGFNFLLLDFSLAVKSPRLSAIALFIASKNVNVEGDYTVLCQGRSIFMEDIGAMARFGRRIKYVSIHRVYWKKVFFHFLSEADKKDISEHNYHFRTFPDHGEEKYRNYLRKLLPILRKLIKFQAVLSGNIGYLEQQEIINICREIQTPYIVLDKEGITMSNDLEIDMELLSKKRFFGSKVLFYNESVRQSVLNLKPIGLTQANTAVVGIPRLDFYFHDKKRQSKNQIVFFAFRTEYRFGLLVNDRHLLEKLFQRSEDFYKMVMEFALRHKDIKVIIKTKVAESYSNYIYDILKRNFRERIPNLEITNSGNVGDLILDSKAVIGYNSTTLLEALIADKLTISPYFGDLIPNQNWDYFSEFPEMNHKARNLADLEEYILNYSKYCHYDPKRKEEYLSRFMPLPFGQASVKAEEEIIKSIKEKSE